MIKVKVTVNSAVNSAYDDPEADLKDSARFGFSIIPIWKAEGEKPSCTGSQPDPAAFAAMRGP